MLPLSLVLCAALCTAAAIQSSTALAVEWLAEPQVTWQSLHNSNPSLVREGRRGVTMHRLDLSLPVSAESENTGLQLEPQLHIIRNPGWSELDRDEYAVGLDANRTMGAGNYGVRGDYTQDTTLTSELLDTGYVGVKKGHTVWSLNPYLNFEVAPSTSMTTAMKYQKQRYQDAETTPLVGYEYVQASLEVAHEFDDRDVVRCGVDHSAMHSDTTTSEDIGGRCSFSREMTERLHGRLTLGGHRSAVTVDALESQSHGGSLAALDLNYESEGARWGLHGSRSIEPSGYGLLLRADKLALTAAYDINESLSANGSVSAYRYVTTTSLPSVLPERDYGVVQWRVVWQWLTEWSLAAGVDYGRQRYSNQNSYANSVTLLMQLNYRPENN